MKKFLKRVLRRTSSPASSNATLSPVKNRETLRSNGDYIQLSMSGRRPTRGWNMLELSIEHAGSVAAVRCYFDSGKGFREEESIFLPLRDGRIAKRVCHLPALVKSVRFEPIDINGNFVIHHFRFVWISPWLAQYRIANRLVNMHHLFRDQRKKDVLKGIKAHARATNVDWKRVALARYDETFIKRCATRSYSRWVEQVETPRLPSRELVPGLIDDFSLIPTISILLPTDNTDAQHLRQCIESVLDQSYPHWQLCIANNASTSAYIRPLLEAYAAEDERIQLIFHSSNGHNVALSNSALSLASGEYIALLNDEDLLAEHALLKVVQALNEMPDAVVLYSDEDKIDAEGKRFDPYFKPGWNLDLLLSQNYMSHLGVYKAERVRTVGGFCEGVEGHQNYDLMLRCLSCLHDKQIVHIPEILYHRREINGPTSEQAEEKRFTTTVGVKMLSDYFARDTSSRLNGLSIEPGLLPNTYRVRWPIPKNRPLVSLLIPTRDGYEILKRCVDSILEKTTYDNYEILILNNQSRCSETLRYLETVTANKRVNVHNWNHSFNYSSINNFGAKKASGTIIGLLNNDIEVITPEWLDEMVSHACREDVGCVGGMLYYPNNTVQHAGVVLGIGGVAGHAHKYFNRHENGYFSRLKLVQNYSAVTGACLLVRKSVFEQVGGLNEEQLAVAFNDVDLCLKVREAGYRNLWTPYAELYHHESLTRGANDTHKKRARARREADYMRKRWGALLDNDPAYNPNLTLIHEDFSLR